MKAYPEIIEEWLVLNCQNGDQKALELLIKRWQPKMVRQVYLTTHDQVATQDIVQEAWITIIRKLNTLRDPRTFAVWSLRIATNKAIDWIRANQTSRKRDEIRKVAQAEFSEPMEDNEHTLAAMRAAIEKLPPNQKMVISMLYKQNLSVQKIAAILEIPEGTVKSRLFKAREQLKKILKTKPIES